MGDNGNKNGEGFADFTGSLLSLASDFTGSNYDDWTHYTATATQFQSSVTSASTTTSASFTTITTTNSDGEVETQTIALGAATGTQEGAAQTTTISDDDSSGGMSTGVRAAIGVGAVVGIIAIGALLFFCMRRRRRRGDRALSNEDTASVTEKPRRGWVNHFRNFTFDNEMLLSERGSVRTGRSVTGSIRSANTMIGGSTSYHNVSTEADLHNAPSNGTNQVPPMLVMTDVDGHSTLDRSLSVRTDATPPPPYQAAAAAADAATADSPISPVSPRHNPFSDSAHNSPVEPRASTDENPFSDNYRSR